MHGNFVPDQLQRRYAAVQSQESATMGTHSPVVHLELHTLPLNAPPHHQSVLACARFIFLGLLWHWM
jgi:hypothetical protein